MSHADYILLQPTKFNKNSLIARFDKLIEDILKQFRDDQLDKAITSIVKCVPDEAKLGLIDGAIAGKCKALKILNELTHTKFDNYVPKILGRFSINEQFYILAHMNLELVNPKPEEPNPVFANLVYSIIRHFLVSPWKTK